jgi:hypothetical protein
MGYYPMGIAVFLFGLLVGVFHFQESAPEPTQQLSLSAEPVVPANYSESAPSEQLAKVATTAAPGPDIDNAPAGPYAALATAESIQQLAQTVADIVAAKPSEAAATVTIALAQIFNDSTLGDIALIAATATKAAPTQAPAIAGAVARSIGSQSDTALAAAIASIVSLVPEQSDAIGMVVGAVIGNDPDALAMVAQTVAIAVGQETFSSLSEGSGVSMAELMKRSSNLGIQVPFDVPNFAAQFAPSASTVAESVIDVSASEGEM